jgi:hypothetical protein
VIEGHQMAMAAVADTLGGEHDTRLWRVAAHYVEAAQVKKLVGDGASDLG